MNETIARMARAWRLEERRWSNRRNGDGWEAVRSASHAVSADEAAEAIHDLGPEQHAAGHRYAEIVDTACARSALLAIRNPTGAVAESLDHGPGGHGREAWAAAIDAALR